jgi:putative ABC transport system permease protein
VGFGGTRVFRALGQSLPRADLLRLGLTGNAIPRLNEVALNTPALFFTLALTIVTGVLFGLVPALQLRRHPIQGAAKNVRGLRTLLVTVQVGLTFVLLVGAGLLIKSFLALATTNVGYDPQNVLTFRVPQPALEYPKDSNKQKQQNAFAEEVVRRLKSVRGVQAAAFTNALPLAQGFWLWVGDAPRTEVHRQEGRSAVVSSDYFKAMGIRVVRGRVFTDADMAEARAVYVVNRAAVQEYFRNINPVGRTISTFAGSDNGEIVGIVDDTRQSGPDTEPAPQIFMHPEHINGAAWGEGYYFVVRSTQDASVMVPMIRAIIRDIDPAVTVDDIATMGQVLSNSITTPRSYAVLLGTFSAVALALASIGLYGVLSYFVKQHSHEIGIRVALGARKRTILRLVVGQGLTISVAGLVFGLAGAMALTRYMRAMLFEVRPLDLATFVLVSSLVLAVTLLASYIPARHATTVDPMTALRHE